MNYRENTRKTLTLPSGATITIRKLRTSDFLALGDIPLVGQENGAHRRTEGPTPREIEYGMKMSKVILLNCCGPIMAGNEKLRIVDKPFTATLNEESEISIEELAQSDADAIIAEVMAWSGYGKEAAQAAGTFPKEPNTDAHLRSDSAAIRSASE